MSRPVYRCPKCGSENVTFMADVTISAPMKFFHRMNKRAFRSKDVMLWCVDWRRADIVCHDCLYSTGLGRDKPL